MHEIINTSMFPLLILTESILFSLVPTTLICLLGNIRLMKWNRAVHIYNNDSIGIAPILTDMWFSIIDKTTI